MFHPETIHHFNNNPKSIYYYKENNNNDISDVHILRPVKKQKIDDVKAVGTSMKCVFN